MEAAKEFSDAISFSPGKAVLRVWAGKSFAVLGDKAKAREYWLEALKLEPDNSEVKKLLEGR
jgi:Tfp pilus assembly protein PilF